MSRKWKITLGVLDSILPSLIAVQLPGIADHFTAFVVHSYGNHTEILWQEYPYAGTGPGYFIEDPGVRPGAWLDNIFKQGVVVL